MRATRTPGRLGTRSRSPRRPLTPPHPPARSLSWRVGIPVWLLLSIAVVPSALAQPPVSTLDWLVAHSSDIVRGRVLSLESAWNPDHTQIVTAVRLAVDERLKGDGTLVLELVQPGGQVGDILQGSSHGAVFRLDEEVVVFAQPAVAAPGPSLRLSSFAEGKLPLERDEQGALWLARGVLGAVAPQAGLESDALGRVLWGDFADHLRSRIAEGSENGLHRRSAPSQDGLTSVAAPASPVQGQPLETAGFHVIGNFAAGSPSTCPNAQTPFNHWDLREFPGCQVPYEIDSFTDQPMNIAAVAFVNEVHAAAGRWNAVTPSHISLFDNTQISFCRPNVQDNRNCVGWLMMFPWGATQIGNTTFWVNVASGKLLEADVFLNPNVAWQVTPNPLPNPCPVANGVQSTLIHEFGHFVGLDHPDEPLNGAACNDDDPMRVTKMYSRSTGLCQVSLHQADKDGINYLYTQDLGDLPDPPYPTKVHQNLNSGQILSGVALKKPNDGPSHLFGIYQDSGQVNFPRYQYEWLAINEGAIDDHPQECEARPVDAFDDGVVFNFDCNNNQIQGKVTVLVSAKTSADIRGRVHTYDRNHRMYINGWFDWNVDGDFADLVEHAIRSFAITAPGAYVFKIMPPAGARCDFASRVRLDWREDAGQALAIDPTLQRELGAAQHGEVEDYLLPPKRWPSLDQDPRKPPTKIPAYCHPRQIVTVFSSGFVVGMLDLCHPPKPKNPVTEQPPDVLVGGGECMDSTLTVGIDVDLDGLADESVGLTGTVCVQRSDPFVDSDGIYKVRTEMVQLDMFGTSELAGDLFIGLADYSPGEIHQNPVAASLGFDFSGEFPAYSFFEVSFFIDSELLGFAGPITALVEAEIGEVPPGEAFDELPPLEPIPGEEAPIEEEPIEPTAI